MFFQTDELQYPVEVEEPDPQFAKMLQQAIGGVEGEMRIAFQYLFQAWSMPDEHERYKKMLYETAAEEIGHVEMLATAVAKNLEGAPRDAQETVRGRDPLLDTMMRDGMPRQPLSAGMHALPVDANGVPFNGSWVVASGNLAADMYANINAESTGRLLVTRLYEMTDDPGMKDMLAYLIARDTMHQNQWHTVLDEIGEHLPVPKSFPQEQENQDFNYSFVSTTPEEHPDPQEPWTQGQSFDGNGEYSYEPAQPGGGKAHLKAAIDAMHNEPDGGTQETSFD
jgi:Mn-containing catalase